RVGKIGEPPGITIANLTLLDYTDSGNTSFGATNPGDGQQRVTVSSGARREYVPEGVAWINTGHIEPDGTLSTEWMHFITRKKFDSLRSGKVRPGDLVYCLRGATLGKTAIITQYEEGAVASSLVIIRLIPAVEPRFAYRFLTSPLGREQIFQFDNGSAQPNLSANSVKKYWVPIPPLAEQRRIVAKVSELMALVDALESQLTTSCATAENLLAAVVAELTDGTHASPAC
ncbi:MAG: hypothetical protein EXS21_10360, partial [Pedosphaera sp.]|nr:hypothetical protein [Pedosphaera sp.]